MQLVSRFVTLDRKHGGSSLHVGMDGWIARPITVRFVVSLDGYSIHYSFRQACCKQTDTIAAYGS